MSSKTEPKDKPINSRAIFCPLSTGRVGKSFFAQGVISALKYEQVAFAAIDADQQHKTLSRRHPTEATLFDATRSLDEFSAMIKALPVVPAILIDFPAQATGFLLDAAKKLQLLDFFDQQRIRATLLIFAADDETAMESASNTVRFFGDRADYLLVENSARFKSTSFKHTPLAKWFEERHTPTLEIPHITASTMEAWTALERKLGRFITLDQVIKQNEMHALSRLELDYARNRFLVQCEDYAERLLPDAGLIKTKVVRASDLEALTVSPLTDEFLKV